MYTQFSAFPAVYFHARCMLHNSRVILSVETGSDFGKTDTITGQVMPTACEGVPESSPTKDNCSGSWVLNVTASGPVKIVP